MQTNSTHSETILQAVFSVCASDEDASAVLAAAANVTGCQFAGEFHEYISANRRPQFSTALRTATACVALIDCDRDPELALETMQRLQQTFLHKINLIGIASQADAAFLLRAMRAGCSDFLNKPVDTAQLSSALTRFQSCYLAAALTAHDAGKIISFYGVKGGVGTTTLAVHVATHLVRKHRKKVLLIDHKHELGHVALYLGLKQSMYYFDELIRNVDRLDPELLEGLVTRHACGLEVMPSPEVCATPHESSAPDIERVMDYLRRHYDYILVDSSMQYINSLGPIMTASDEVTLVCTPDVAALRDLARHIEHLSLINGFTGKLRVVINRSTSDDAVTSEQIETAVRFPVSLAIPNNYSDLVKAINAGEPISPQQRGGFSQSVAKWADRLVSSANSAVPMATTRKRLTFWR